MERYTSGTHSVDPVEEWTAPGGQTGLEEPMWQLGLGGSGPESSYPERPNEPDCIYYLRTGFCGYADRCRFNHPPDRTNAAMGAVRAGGEIEYPERAGQPICQYYMRTGMCKFGASCKYHHPKHGIGSSPSVPLNFHGYPLRPGENECSYYVKTGQCKFGITCKFHHPQPAGIQLPAHTPSPGPMAASGPTAAVYPNMQSPVQSSQQFGVVSGNWPVPRPPMLPGSYVPGSYGPMLLPPGVVPVSGWTPYTGSMSPGPSQSPQPTVGASPVYGFTQLSPSATAYTGAYLPIASSSGSLSRSQREHSFPQRPGQQECQYYMRTGDCKFGSTCKYHHPPEWSAPKTSFELSPMGLPLRPGAPLCSHYSQNGMCRFGPSCKFDHPMRSLSYSPSASSLTDMPVAPYPVGSTIATLAPSSSSSDLRPEFSSGHNKDAFAAIMSAMNTSSASVGSIFSSSGAVPQSSTEQALHVSTSQSGDSNASPRGEVRTST